MWIWLIGALTAIATGAAALNGHVVVTAEDGPGTIEPGGAPGTWELTVTYETSRPLLEEVTVDLATDAGSAGLQPVVSPSTLTFSPQETEPGLPRYSYERSAMLSVAAHRYAPAYVSAPVTVTPEANAGGLEDPDEHPTRVPVTPTFRPGLAVEPQQAVIDVAPDEEVHARAELDSTANGDSLVTVQRIEAPDGCEAEPVQAEVVVGLAGEDEMMLHVACSAGADDGALEVTFRQAYAVDTSVDTATTTASWQINVDESAAAQAAFGPIDASGSDLGLLAGVGLAALSTTIVARRGRE